MPRTPRLALAAALASLFASPALACPGHEALSPLPKEARAAKSTSTAAAPAGEATSGDLTISGAWVREVAAGRDVTAGFLTITNAGAAADRLVAVSASIAPNVEIHTHEDRDGVMRMVKVDGVDIPAGGVATLAPGGDHLMMFGVTDAAAGATAELTLTFESAGEVTFQAPIDTTANRLSVAPAAHGGHHGH